MIECLPGDCQCIVSRALYASKASEKLVVCVYAQLKSGISGTFATDASPQIAAMKVMIAIQLSAQKPLISRKRVRIGSFSTLGTSASASKT